MRRRVPWGSDHSITACRRPPNTAEGLNPASTPPRLTGSPGATNICSMPTRIVEQTQQCPYCLLATVVVTVEQLVEQARGCRRVDRAVEGVVHVADEAHGDFAPGSPGLLPLCCRLTCCRVRLRRV